MVVHDVQISVDDEVYNKLLVLKGRYTWQGFMIEICKRGLGPEIKE